MRQGWVFTSTPITDGRELCILTTSARALHARVEPHNVHECLAKMIDLAVQRGDDVASPILND